MPTGTLNGMGIASDLIYIVLAALVGGLVAHSLRQPLIFGYILAGVAVGPYTGGITVHQPEDIKMLAEMGIALLLFAIGLEFSFSDLKRLAKISFVATPIQVAVCALGGYILALATGMSAQDAIWFGSAISLSSTMVVIKLLEARHTLDTDTGRLGVAVLVAQDLAVVPIMLIVPQLAQQSIGLVPLLLALGKSVLFLALILVAGNKLLPRFFRFISRQGSRELLFLATLGIVFGAGAAFHAMGFSFALGAFVAGMLLSETDFRSQAHDDVAGLRDLFALIFFASVGMLFDPRAFMAKASTIIPLTLGVVVLKAVSIAAIVRIFGSPTGRSLTVGVGLAQVGEFAFVIGGAGMALGLLSGDSFSVLLSVTLLSMVVTPVLFALANYASRRLGNAE